MLPEIVQSLIATSLPIERAISKPLGNCQRLWAVAAILWMASEPFLLSNNVTMGCAMTACFPPQQFKGSSDIAVHGPEPVLDLLVETLDLIDLAVMLVDRTGRVFYANRAASGHLSAGSIIRLCCGRLVPLSAESSAGMRAALANLRNGSSQSRHGVVVPLNDADGLIRAVLWVLPLSSNRGGRLDDVPGAECAALVIREIAPPRAISNEFFTRSYGVTQAEARLLKTLAEGMTVSEAGEVLKVSLNTVKSHLKSLFAKTGTNRQAELIRLVLSTAPPASI